MTCTECTLPRNHRIHADKSWYGYHKFAGEDPSSSPEGSRPGEPAITSPGPAPSQGFTMDARMFGEDMEIFIIHPPIGDLGNIDPARGVELLRRTADGLESQGLQGQAMGVRWGADVIERLLGLGR